MNLLEIQSYTNDFNKLQQDIENLNFEIKELLLQKADKEERNRNQFQKRLLEIKKIEENIKSKMDNKYFKFIKHYDFLDAKEKNITLYNMEINEELGCLTRRVNTEQEISPNEIQFSNDKKILHYFFKNSDISNAIYYSFYRVAGNGLPIVPKHIYIRYKEHMDNLYEPYFRYYNRNNKKSFVTTVLFEPKKINEVIFEFEHPINTENASCKLLSRSYSDNNKVDILIENPYKIKTFNITKKSSEVIPLIFQYTEDGFTFKDITFSKELEGIIPLEKNRAFTLRILSDNDKLIAKKEKTIEFEEKFSKEIHTGFGIYQLPLGEKISFETIEIIFPTSSVEKIKNDLGENHKIVEKFLNEKEQIYFLLKNFLKTNSENKRNEKLKYVDNINILQSDNDLANFFFDKNTNTLCTSSFFDKYPFFIKYQHQKENEDFSQNYFTNILFEFSLKG